MPHVVFVHGMLNKPPAKALLEVLERTLARAGCDLGTRGVTLSLAYWADLLYATPLVAGDEEAALTPELVAAEVPQRSPTAMPEPDTDWAARFRAHLEEGAVVAGISPTVSGPAASPRPGAEDGRELLPGVFVKPLLNRVLRDVSSLPVQHVLLRAPGRPAAACRRRGASTCARRAPRP